MSNTATVLQLDRDILGDFPRYAPDLAESGLIVDGETFGALTGIHPRTVRDLDNRGIVVKVARDRYDLAASLRAYAAHLRAMAAGRTANERDQPDTGADDRHDPAKLSGAYERARLNRAKADAKELKNAALRRELVKAKDVEREWGERAAPGALSHPRGAGPRAPAPRAPHCRRHRRDRRRVAPRT